MSLRLDSGVQPMPGYTLVSLLGRGGFGEVWEAIAPGDFHVALKFIRLDTNEAAFEQRSLDVIRNIRHPHLLDVQFATRVDDCLVIAMPLCDESLRDRLRAAPHGLPRDELLGYMEELARAVDYLNEPRHQAEDGSMVGVQHRDIKPHNIFLVGGSVRLADFGLAKTLASNSGSHTGSMSPNYVAPELIQGRVSKQSDQYSLAVTYVHLRTGKLPFVGENEVAIMYAHVHSAPDLSGLPEAERPVVARALAKQPEERWPSSQAFVRALVASGLTFAPGAGAGRRAKPATGGETKLPETQVLPPISPTRVDDGSQLGVEVEARDSRHRRLRRIGPAGLAALFAVLVPLIVLPRLRSPSVETPPASMPLTNSLGMKLVLIPAGEFLMGSPDSDKDAEDDEKPQHRVRITRPFYLAIHEVTQGQYWAVTGENPSEFKGSDDLPVESVSWNDALAFCNKLSEREGLRPYYQSGAGARTGGNGYRLPTESEWEYACRARSTARYSFGDAEGLVDWAWHDGNSGRRTHPVGQKQSNAFGLFDMHGNVREWCQDWYDKDYYGQSPGTDPLGPSQAADRVSRGGCWGDDPLNCRSAYRYRFTPGLRGNGLGLRVARVQSSR